MLAGAAHERCPNGEITKLPTRATVPTRTLRSPHYGVRIAVSLGAALAVAPAPVLAEMQVSGTPNAVRLEARDAPLEEILAALNRAFGVHYQLSVNLDNRLSGTYEGSLPQVLTGILNGYNFLLYTDNGATAVTVVGNAPSTSPGPASSSAVRQPAPAAPSAQVVRQPSPAAPSAQASSGVKDATRKGPSSLLESVAEQSGATAPAPPPQPRPSTTALQPKPSTQAAPQWRPSTQAAPQWRPSTEAPQPRPSTTAAPQPRPLTTAAPQPRPSTVAPPGQFTGLPP
jgi:hypothetical protein